MMNEIYPSIYEVLPSKPTPNKYRSFFIQRAEGNLLVPCFANTSTIDAHFDAMLALGGLQRQLLGDSHFRSTHNDVVAKTFGAPLYCSDVEAMDVLTKVSQVVTFPFVAQAMDTSVDIIPTPGHRNGGVCYLVTLGTQRYLFVGDFIWHEGTHWIPTPSKSTVNTYRQSLERLATVACDVLLANTQLSNPIYAVALNDSTRAEFFDALAQQLV